MSRSPSPRVLLAVTAVAALAAMTALGPASQAAPPGPKPLPGSLVQAWKAMRYRPVHIPTVPTRRLYLTGTSLDQVNKVAGTPTASMSPAAPTGSSNVVQDTNPLLANGGSNDAGSAFWSGTFSGRINGVITLNWYWATLDAKTALDNIALSVFADPGTKTEKQIGSETVSVTTFGNTPQLVTSRVHVSGWVGKTIQISARPIYADASEDLRVYYGSSATPSRVDIPIRTMSIPVPRNPTVRDTNPLVVQATRIGRKAVEPTIGLTNQGNAFIVASYFDGLSPATPRTLIYASYDKNRSWHDVTPYIAGQSFPPTTLDPYLYVDRSTGRVFSDDLLAACSELLWSDDQGKTWSKGNPQACESPVDDHQTIVAGKPTAGVTTVGYPNVIYYCVNKIADAQCARSIDGGMTFGPTGAPAFEGVQQPGDGSPHSGPIAECGGLHGHIITDPGGRLFLPKGHCDQPWLAISEDGGTTWHQTLVNRMVVAGIQTAVASDTAGNLYYVWWAHDTDLPYMAVSRDHGLSFGPAMLVAPPGVQAVNFPSIDASDPGHVVLTFPGTTDPLPSAARPWNYYMAVTTNALDDQPVFHSATANAVDKPIHRGLCLGRCAGMFDFLDTKFAANGEAWGAEVQTCTSDACETASGPALSAREAANDAQGIVVRELSGPGIRKRSGG